LEDIDWRRGELVVRGKGNRLARLPRAPYRALSSTGITTVVAGAGRWAGLGTIGGHRLRHSAATAMLRAGGSLREGRPRAAPLRDALDEYLSLRRALGLKLKNAGRLLGQFVDYLEARGINTVTTQYAFAWASLPAEASSHWRALRLSVVRGFAAYLHAVDRTGPPAGLVRSGVCRATPYLYSTAEISSLLHAATELRPRLRAATYQSLIGLLAASGIRIGEGIALDHNDLDTHADLLVVREVKFAKSRLVPLHQPRHEPWRSAWTCGPSCVHGGRARRCSSPPWAHGCATATSTSPSPACCTGSGSRGAQRRAGRASTI